MFELLVIFLVIGAIIFAFKIFGWLIELGVFLLAIPFKIVFGILGAVFGLIALPLLLVPALLAVLAPLSIVALVIGGVVMLVR